MTLLDGRLGPAVSRRTMERETFVVVFWLRFRAAAPMLNRSKNEILEFRGKSDFKDDFVGYLPLEMGRRPGAGGERSLRGTASVDK